MTNQIMKSLRFENSHNTNSCLKTGRIEIEHKGGIYFDFNIEVEKDFVGICTCDDDEVDDCTCESDVETWSEYIPVSAEQLKPLYEVLKSHFEPTTRMATLTIPHDNS